MRRLDALGLLTLLALGGGCAPAASLPDSAFGNRYYTVSILGSRSGYSQQTLTRLPDGVEAVERTILRVRMDGETLVAERTERRCYDERLRLIEIDHHANQIGRKMSVKAIRQGDKLLVTREDPEGVKRSELALPESFGDELQAQRAVAAGEVKPGWSKTVTTFDSDLTKLDEITLTVGDEAETPRASWLITAHSKLLDLDTKMWVGFDGTLLRQEIPGMMQMTLQLASEEEALAEATPAELVPDIEVTGPRPSATGQRRLRLRATAPVGSLEGAIPATRRQTVTPEGRSLIVDTLAETPPTEKLPLPVTAPEFQEYLRPTDLAQSADPAITTLAREIIGDERDAWQAASKLTRWVHRKLKKVDSEPRPVSALEILKMNSGDCTEHSILLAALAQSVGLPARVVAGLVYDAGAYHYHAWNELYVGRWVEMDATWGQETVDAGHLQLANAALDSAAMARLSLASAKTMGNLNLEIIEYR